MQKHEKNVSFFNKTHLYIYLIYIFNTIILFLPEDKQIDFEENFSFILNYEKIFTTKKKYLNLLKNYTIFNIKLYIFLNLFLNKYNTFKGIEHDFIKLDNKKKSNIYRKRTNKRIFIQLNNFIKILLNQKKFILILKKFYDFLRYLLSEIIKKKSNESSPVFIYFSKELFKKQFSILKKRFKYNYYDSKNLNTAKFKKYKKSIFKFLDNTNKFFKIKKNIKIFFNLFFYFIFFNIKHIRIKKKNYKKKILKNLFYFKKNKFNIFNNNKIFNLFLSKKKKLKIKKKYFCLIKKKRNNCFITIINELGEVKFSYSLGKSKELIRKKEKKLVYSIRYVWSEITKYLKLKKINKIFFLIQNRKERYWAKAIRSFKKVRLKAAIIKINSVAHNNIKFKKKKKIKRL